MLLVLSSLFTHLCCSLNYTLYWDKLLFSSRNNSTVLFWTNAGWSCHDVLKHNMKRCSLVIQVMWIKCNENLSAKAFGNSLIKRTTDLCVQTLQSPWTLQASSRLLLHKLTFLFAFWWNEVLGSLLIFCDTFVPVFVRCQLLTAVLKQTNK